MPSNSGGVNNAIYNSRASRWYQAACARKALAHHHSTHIASPLIALVVDRNRIGIIGICGFGGMGLSAAAVDKRIKNL